MHQPIRISTIFSCTILALFLSFSPVDKGIAQEKLEWLDFDEALSKAATTGKAVLVDVWAPWCGWCRKMKREVYPKLSQRLEQQFILTRLNRDDNQTEHRYQNNRLTSRQLAQKLLTQSVPAIVMLDSNGQYLLHLSGFMDAETLHPVLQYIGSGAYHSMRFEEFKWKES